MFRTMLAIAVTVAGVAAAVAQKQTWDRWSQMLLGGSGAVHQTYSE